MESTASPVSAYQQEMDQFYGDPLVDSAVEKWIGEAEAEHTESHDKEPAEADNENTSFALRQFLDDGFTENLIKNIPSISQNPVDLERQTDRLKDILDRYQEQPQLVDAFLGKWVKDLINFVKIYAEEPSESTKKSANLSLTVLRLLTKLRGYKVIIRYLPHDPADVEQSLGLVEKFSESPDSTFEDWEQQYMLLLWLSIAVQTPFDLKKLTDPDDIGTPRSIEERIFHVCQEFITVSEKTRDAAAYLLSRFVTRPDTLPVSGQNMVDFLLNTLENGRNADFVKKPHILCGCLAGIATIFKSGTRSHLKALADYCLPRLVELGLIESEFSMVRKYVTKALQRLALIFLTAKLPTWRYKRGFRSLEDNIAVSGRNMGAGDSPPNPMGNGVHSPLKEAEEDVSPYVEQVIGLLLQALNDADGVIRWSAAKGIGRISERLPQGYAGDVLNHVLSLFSYERSENAWHGGCLALAELGRRGALLPSRFGDVIPVVLRALLYEELRGTYAVGSTVRDAACYVCWAFARAYEPKDLEEYVIDIATHLVLTALFDRSVNCRRAASAAFQEHVGRQGNFPRGLDIITVLDFESLGRRSNTYLKLSPIIAQYPEYTSVILDFLLSHRLAHWDVSVRELAAQTLLLLTPVAPDHVKHYVAPELLKRIGSSHLFTRHGAMIGLGYICEGLHNCGHFDDFLAGQVESVILEINPKDVFRGFGHEVIRQAVMSLISRVSNAQLPLHNKPHLLGQMIELVQSNVVADNPKIQEIAINTLQSLMKTYGTSPSPADHSKTLQEVCLDQVLRNVKSSSELMRRYSVLGLSVFSTAFCIKNLALITDAIVSACPRCSCPEPQWVDCRRNCCRSLDRLLGVVPASAFTSDLFCEVIDFLGDCLSDYTEDKRGNIGRIVRLAALDTARSIMSRIERTHPLVLTPERLNTVVMNLLRLFAEGIPDLRARAGQLLLYLAKSDDIPDFTGKSDMRAVFCRSHARTAVWGMGSRTYPFAVRLLSVPAPEVRAAIMLGLVSSLGSLTESTVRESSAAFRKYAQDHSRDLPTMISLVETLTEAVKHSVKEERLVLPALNSLKQIFAGGVFCQNVDEKEPQLLIDLLSTVQHIRLSQSTPKVVALVEVYAEALQFADPTRKVALERLLPFLSHVYPRVRVVAATKFHESIVTCDGILPEDDQDTVCTLLTETQWAHSLEKSQEALQNIASLLRMNVRPMQLKVKKVKS